jgi:hypothetical protein
MSLVKIYYNQFHANNMYGSPFSLDGVGYDIESRYSLNDFSDTYSDCPVWKHKSTRTFVVRSPINISFIVDRKTETLECFDIEEELFKEYFYPTTDSENWVNPKAITIQLSFPRFMFWTDSKNVWIEQRPYALTSLNNNLVCVNGWFNLSSWTRAISFAFDIVDHNKPVTIKKGDILYEVCFYPENLNDGILLKKEEVPKDIFDGNIRRTNLKNYNTSLTKYLPFKRQTKKCPFKFMWK